MKPAKGSDTAVSLTFPDFCKLITPPCRLNPFFFNGHIQTFVAAAKNGYAPIHYRRKIFQSNDKHAPGTFAVDFLLHPYDPKGTTGKDEIEPAERESNKTDGPPLPPRTHYFSEEEWDNIGSTDTKPMLVVLHGICGGSHELYVRQAIAPLVSKYQEDNHVVFEACVLNARGCANAVVTSPMLFNARATWDLKQLIDTLRETFPNRPIFALGFSLGANILTNYLGEAGDKCPIKAAVLISNPWNLEVGSLHLQRTWFRRNIYSRTLNNNMKRLFEKNVEIIKQNAAIPIEKVRRAALLHEFDRALQTVTWGYPTEGAYYRDASSTEPMLSARVPIFAINAEDDPVAPYEALPFEEAQQNPYTVLCTTSLGGHVGWYEWSGERWFIKTVAKFFRKMAEEVDLEALGSQKIDSDFQDLRKRSKQHKPIFDPVRRKLDENPHEAPPGIMPDQPINGTISTE